ncbi:2-polyprenyl-6-methoxyphenol hydroxylase-like FAD-dependent oxidoreductase [Kitasatospora sp. GP30]|uniref:FAD-dependent monooxygenase n=1 Tax=Kitasatospora sp. GP30 TaxID=3035084 RepID=UPI000C70FF9E|nr:FAD-dependent monooxygenase [Kitasatospora sp. GP30]MDH6144099.1 2-polyprenyl-6-methoxyphenol hydroxylase-like FAD-dependent oxidoreductase [Kitasatospora sp. GP30]
MEAIVIGGGIGGLAAALALHRLGHQVTVHERAASLEPVGAGLAVAPNALRALDRLGIGDHLRAHAGPDHPAAGLRRPSGRRLARVDYDAMAGVFGDRLVAVARSVLVDTLAAALPPGTVRTGSPAELLDHGTADRPAVVRTADGERTADLVVGADGIRSATRATLFPRHPGPRYSGFTTWRTLIPSPPRAPSAVGEIWGSGGLVGVVPLVERQLYVYAAALATDGSRAADGDELAELRRHFGTWCEPVPELLAAADPNRVLRHDVWEIADPLPAYHHGRVALLGDAAHAMSPFQGQGACQAIEDALVLATTLGTDPVTTLPAYTAARLPRTTAIVAGSRRVGALVARNTPAGVLVRDALLAVTGLLPQRLVLRQMARTYGWEAPVLVKSDRVAERG